mmetsp:Transcript_19361/g.33007  ORF Transcript_19361/g.33007 Transcript_19361/m.33007 type:complete len:259 (-) Transcript_19361:76-852(-)
MEDLRIRRNMINSKKVLANSSVSMLILLSTCARRLVIEAGEIKLLVVVVLDRLAYHPSQRMMIQENLKEEGAKREIVTTIDAEDIVIMRTIAIEEEEEDDTSEESVTTNKSTIQIQCLLSHLILITRGVENTPLAQGATVTMGMTDVIIVDMIVTEDIQDPETTGTITGTIMTTNQGEEVMIGPEATVTGSIAGMIMNTNLGVEESTEDMITMTSLPILQTLLKSFQILIVVLVIQDAMAMQKTKVCHHPNPSQSLLD